MAEKLLTLIVPTYNRQAYLARLLRALREELVPVEDMVTIMVANNASPDGTVAVIDEFARETPLARIFQRPVNIGADENFCCCIEQVSTPYFWIMGDDDLPRAGVLAAVVQLLREQRPDLLYLHSEWRPDVGDDRCRGKEPVQPWQLRGREEFAATVHVWMTFISGMVIHLDYLRAQGGLDLRRYSGSYLVQMGWVLPALMTGHRFITVDQPWILATQENTGGYKLLTVFGRNLVEVVESACGVGSPVAQRILRPLLWNYLPGLLWGIRNKGAQTFQSEDVLDALSPLRRFAAYRWLLVPLYRLPLPLAKLLMLVPRIYGKWLRVRYG
jgi:glycosyltransferase involved in cell wall biosynthesis